MTKLQTLGILLSTAARAAAAAVLVVVVVVVVVVIVVVVVVAKVVILSVLFLTSFTLALREALVTTLVILSVSPAHTRRLKVP